MSFRQLIRRTTPRSLRNWIRSPTKSTLYITDRIRFAFGAAPSASPADGWSVRCHPAATRYFEIFRKDPDQADELRAFAAHCSSGMRLLDIGAHYGLFALAALHYGGVQARALCVEASQHAIKVLRANMRLNAAQSRVSVVNCAMGCTDGRLPMVATGPLGGDYFVVPTEPRSDTVLVPQRSMRSLLTETRFGPTHVKMDIEGFEAEVIESSIETLSKYKPVVFLELHGPALRARGKDPASVIHNLRKAGLSRFLHEMRTVDEHDIARLGFTCRLVCLP